MTESLFESNLDKDLHGEMIIERHADNHLSITTGVVGPKGDTSYTSFYVHPDDKENIGAVKEIIAALQKWLDHTKMIDQEV